MNFKYILLSATTREISAYKYDSLIKFLMLGHIMYELETSYETVVGFWLMDALNGCFPNFDMISTPPWIHQPPSHTKQKIVF
jgi:hypothetical protein